MNRALVLNASYEPLCVVSSRRAVVLTLSDKAEVVAASGDDMHSEHLSVPIPSILRLRSYVAVPYRRRVAVSRRAVMARDGGICQYCGRPADSIDHVVPRSKGGPHEWDNVVAACRPCNARKRDSLLHETSMRLRRRPRAPMGTAWSILAGGPVPDGWQPYLADERWSLPEAVAG